MLFNVENADALVVNHEHLRLVIEPGSNEGSYITLYEGACWIMSWRFACYNPDGKDIKNEYRKIKKVLGLSKSD